MKSRYLWLGVGMLLLVSGCVDSPDPDASGSEIYSQVCARCHNSDLSGGIGPALGVGSASVDQPDEFLRQTISRGLGRMPGFSRTLTEDQIERLIIFLRERQQP